MKRFNNAIRLAVPVALAISLAACDKKPGGQIVAVVNDEEISLSELNQELRGVNVPAGNEKAKKEIMRVLLQRVVDRRLLAQAAREQGIDRDPAYLASQRRMNEELLVQMYAKRAADGIKLPDVAAVDKYVRENPAIFANRTRLTLSQVAFPAPTNPELLKQFQNDRTLEAVAATATRLGLKVERGTDTLDTGSLAPAMLKQIESLPPGEPFIVPLNDRVVVSVITGRQPIIMSPEQSRPIAINAIRNRNLGAIGEARLKEARAKAEIAYEPGYAPQPASKTSPAPAKR